MVGEGGEVLEILQTGQVAVLHDLLGDIGEMLFRFERMLGDIESVHSSLAGTRFDEIRKRLIVVVLQAQFAPSRQKIWPASVHRFRTCSARTSL